MSLRGEFNKLLILQEQNLELLRAMHEKIMSLGTTLPPSTAEELLEDLENYRQLSDKLRSLPRPQIMRQRFLDKCRPLWCEMRDKIAICTQQVCVIESVPCSRERTTYRIRLVTELMLPKWPFSKTRISVRPQLQHRSKCRPV